MEDEAAAGLDRAAVVNDAIGGVAGIDIELAEQASQTNAGAQVTDADADRAIVVMHCHRDDRAVEARVGHAGHCQEQLAGQETRDIHDRTMPVHASPDKPSHGNKRRIEAGSSKRRRTS